MQEVRLAFIESAKAIRAQRLHDARVHKRIVMMHEGVALKADHAAQRVSVMIQQLLSQCRRQVRLGVIEQGSNVIVQSAFASALIVEEKGLAIEQHHVA